MVAPTGRSSLGERCLVHPLLRSAGLWGSPGETKVRVRIQRFWGETQFDSRGLTCAHGLAAVRAGLTVAATVAVGIALLGLLLRDKERPGEPINFSKGSLGTPAAVAAAGKPAGLSGGAKEPLGSRPLGLCAAGASSSRDGGSSATQKRCKKRGCG